MLETKFRPNRRIFVFWRPFWFKMATIANQNGLHMVQHVLLPVNIHFHWNLFIFEFLTIFFIFILAAILKILKTKSRTLSDDLFLCQVSKGPAVRFEFNIFLHLGYHGNGRHFEFFQPPKKSCHTTVDIPTKFYEVWWKESKHFLIPLFCFHGNCGEVCPTDSDFFALFRSTRCGCCFLQVSSNSVRRVICYDHFCVFQFFSILAVSMATAAILKIPKVVCTSTHSA